jgi:hypothetical protein
MGATDFSTAALGRDIGEAFRKARNEALYLDGHGGYTGTLAEKSSYITATLPPRMTGRAFEQAVFEAGELLQNLGYDLEVARDKTGFYKAPERRKAATRAKRAQAKLDKLRLRIPNLDSYARACDDKWGPAVGFELRGREAQAYRKWQRLEGKRGKVYRFFGYASS